MELLETFLNKHLLVDAEHASLRCSLGNGLPGWECGSMFNLVDAIHQLLRVTETIRILGRHM